MASDAAVQGLSAQEENSFRGYVNDAMGLLREGNYEGAEALLKQAAAIVVDDTVRYASILRKLAILYEQQDRVDESHEAWEHARFLENDPSFGRSEKLLAFIKPDSKSLSPATTGGGTKANMQQEKDTRLQNLHNNISRIKDSNRRTQEYVRANKRFVSSVTAMVQEETKNEKELRNLSKGIDRLTHALATVRSGEQVSKKLYEVEWNRNTSLEQLSQQAEKPAHQVLRSKSKTKKHGHQKAKKKSLEELKKIMRGEKTQDQAGHAALSIAFRYVSQANWSMAYTFFRTCIRKENKLLNEQMNELLLLEKLRPQWRSMRDKREGEENISEIKTMIEGSDKLIQRATRGIWELLLENPVAAFDGRVAQLASLNEIEDARLWGPHPPVDVNTPKYLLCAAPIAAKFARMWLEAFPQTEEKLHHRRSWQSGAAEARRISLLYLVGKLHGVVNGPCGNLLAEVFEELLETTRDGYDISLLRGAANLYVRRRHFRRAQELFSRAESIERGEERNYKEKLRCHGKNQIHSTFHIDPSVVAYVENLPALVRNASTSESKSATITASDTAGTLAYYLKKVDRRKSTPYGQFGDPLCDTWDSALASTGTVTSSYTLKRRRNDLVIPTTIGRDKDEDPFLRSVGVEGRTVAATGGVQMIGKIFKGDLHRGGTQEPAPDGIAMERRKMSQVDLWRSHVGHEPTWMSSPQGKLCMSDDQTAPSPTRSWMTAYRFEGHEKLRGSPKTVMRESVTDNINVPTNKTLRSELKTESNVYRNYTSKLENLRNAARRQVKDMVSEERVRMSSTSRSRARSPTPMTPGGMASFWLDSKEHSIASCKSNGVSGSTRDLGYQMADEEVGGTKKARQTEIIDVRIDDGIDAKILSSSEEEQDKNVKLRIKDSLDLLFDSRPSTTNTPITPISRVEKKPTASDPTSCSAQTQKNSQLEGLTAVAKIVYPQKNLGKMRHKKIGIFSSRGDLMKFAAAIEK